MMSRICLDEAASRTLQALIECLFPDDPGSPSATDIGILDYFLKNVLADPRDEDHNYRDGPFVSSAPVELGWQFLIPPSAYFAFVVNAIEAECLRRFGRGFAALEQKARFDIAIELEKGLFIGDISPPTSVFVRMLRDGVQEAVIRDPFFGGNRDYLGWRWLGLKQRSASMQMRLKT